MTPSPMRKGTSEGRVAARTLSARRCQARVWGKEEGRVEAKAEQQSATVSRNEFEDVSGAGLRGREV